MKTFKYLVSLIPLLAFYHSAWAFTAGFASANPMDITNFIQHHNVLIYLGAFFALGILLAFTPCVLPMVPILSGIVVGQQQLSTRRAVKLSLSYVIGMAITYAAAGMMAGYLGSTVQTMMQQPAIIIGFSALFVLMALSMFGFFDLRLPAAINNRLHAGGTGGSKKNYASVALMGVLSTLVVSPCITAPLVGVLTFIGQSGQPVIGGMILFVMAIGMGVPLIIVGAGYGSFLPKTGPWMTAIKTLFGFIMLGMAVWMAARVLPATSSNYLWAALFISASVTFIFAKTLQQNRISQFFKILALAAAAAGSIIAYNNIMPATGNEGQIAREAPFQVVHSMQEIDAALEKARQEKKAVFMEFYAAWCGDCKEMEHTVFNQPEIAQAMAGLVNVKVDITYSTRETTSIKQAFDIYGTPTMLFVDKDGRPIEQLKTVGSVDKTALLKLLKQINP